MARLTDAQKQLFRSTNFADLATLMPDGSPHVSPVWVDIEGNTILVNSAEGRVKVGNVRRDPRVALSVHDEDDPYTMVSVRGRVEEVAEQGADRHIDRLAKKYLGQDRYPNRQPGERRVILRILPEHVTGMGEAAREAA
jgi:PPOX class probable F420-dependent enzyme